MKMGSQVPMWARLLGVGLLAWLGIAVLRPMLAGGSTSIAPSSSPRPDKARAVYLDPRQLAADPKAHIGQNIFLQGRSNTVEQENDHTWIQLMAQVRDRGNLDESIVVELRPKAAAVVRSECYRFYGVVQGTQRVTLARTGDERDVPVVRGYAFEAVPAGANNTACVGP